MKLRYLLAAALLAFATPLQAQARPDSTRAALIQSRGFIRGADSVLTKALTFYGSGPTVDTLFLTDTVRVVDTVYVAQPAPGTEPPPPTDSTDTAPAPQVGTLRRNLPAGWRIVSDYGFDDAPPPHQTKSGSGMLYDGVALGDSGWKVGSWGTSGGGLYPASDPTEITGSPGAIEQRYPAGARGGGTIMTLDFPRTTKLYVSWVVKWSAGFEHNSNSEKMLYFNPDAADYFLFQFHWGSESIYNILPRPEDEILAGDNSIRANLAGRDSRGRPYAPPLDGEWVEYEFIFDSATGLVEWYRNGVPHAHHEGRVFAPVNRIRISDTWGGGGSHPSTCSRYTGHVTVAVGG